MGRAHELSYSCFLVLLNLASGGQHLGEPISQSLYNVVTLMEAYTDLVKGTAIHRIEHYYTHQPLQARVLGSSQGNIKCFNILSNAEQKGK